MAPAGERLLPSGVSEAKALIARSPIVTTEDLLTFARESIALQVGHRSQLAAIPSAPEDRSAVRAMLALFKRAGAPTEPRSRS